MILATGTAASTQSLLPSLNSATGSQLLSASIVLSVLLLLIQCALGPRHWFCLRKKKVQASKSTSFLFGGFVKSKKHYPQGVYPRSLTLYVVRAATNVEEGVSREEHISYGGVRGRKVRAGVPAVRVEGNAHQDVHGEYLFGLLPIFLESFVRQHSCQNARKFKDRFNIHINIQMCFIFTDIVVLRNPEYHHLPARGVARTRRRERREMTTRERCCVRINSCPLRWRNSAGVLRGASLCAKWSTSVSFLCLPNCTNSQCITAAAAVYIYQVTLLPGTLFEERNQSYLVDKNTSS